MSTFAIKMREQVGNFIQCLKQLKQALHLYHNNNNNRLWKNNVKKPEGFGERLRIILNLVAGCPVYFKYYDLTTHSVMMMQNESFDHLYLNVKEKYSND